VLILLFGEKSKAMIFGDKILTPRLKLRRIVESDLPVLVAWSNSETAHGKYLTPDCIDEQRGLESIVSGAYWNDDNRVFLIELRDGKPTEPTEPIGTLHYWLRSEQKGCAVMALKISEPQMRNKGYGTEAQKYAIIHLFTQMKLQRVEMYTDIDNCSQQRCLNKLGFQLADSLKYDDHRIQRVGHLFRIDAATFSQTSMYQYHYEK
jgi:RimJ/RimL family protein N-acetyltransferase